MFVGSLNKLLMGVNDSISGRNDTKCVRKSTLGSGRSAEAAAPRVGSGSPVCATEAVAATNAVSTKTPQRFSDAETTGIASKMAPAVARKKRVTLPSDDTTPYASEGFFLFFF